MKLLLPGDGEQFDACRALAGELGVDDRVVFPGLLSDVRAALRAADAAVSSSRSEGLPFNVMEAMLSSLPVIATGVKGHTDLVEPGVTGLLYPYDDRAALARAVETLLHDPELRVSMGQRGRQRVERFTLPQVYEAVMREYQSVL